MTSEYDPMSEQQTGKPPKCTGCHEYMKRIESVQYSWNDNDCEWEEEEDISVSYQCNNCKAVIDIA